MCGIVGAASTRDVIGVLIEGIKKLEYRGYDSAGIAFLKNGHLERLRSTGRVAHLEEIARKSQTEARTGLSHTRWATHGAPSEANAHPHFSAAGGLEIGVVHNGIVENYEAIRLRLTALGYSFSSETDTEVLAHHVHSLVMAKGLSLFDAVMEASRDWDGAYAAGFISSREPTTVVGTRKGSPLLVGLGQGENFLASDASALISKTREVVYLLEGDIVEVQPERVRIRDGEGRFVDRRPTISRLSQESVELGPYAHYKQKEIFEQPGALGNTLEMVMNAQSLQANLFGSEAEAGKSLGTDLAKGKLTLPVLLALERIPAEARSRLTLLLREWEPGRTLELLSILDQLRVTEHCRSSVHQLLETAREELSALPASESRRSLGGLTDYVAHRTDLLNARA
jgi:glucosamine--fructose-6-phosphate aminotransferase (isomerizing)